MRYKLEVEGSGYAGWAARTKSELAVAQLVANRLTNREIAEQFFVSPHTVNTHLRHVLAKLEFNFRVDLTRLATERKSEPASETAGGRLTA